MLKKTKMKREKRLKWEPLSGVAPTVRLRNIEYKLNHLILNLEDEIDKSSPILTIDFSDFITFRIIDESDLLKGAYDDESLTEIEKVKGYRYHWSLFTIENSHYLEWFRQQNVGMNQDNDIVHYLIFTPDDVIEVLVPEDCSPVAMWN